LPMNAGHGCPSHAHIYCLGAPGFAPGFPLCVMSFELWQF